MWLWIWFFNNVFVFFMVLDSGIFCEMVLRYWVLIKLLRCCYVLIWLVLGCIILFIFIRLMLWRINGVIVVGKFMFCVNLYVVIILLYLIDVYIFVRVWLFIELIVLVNCFLVSGFFGVENFLCGKMCFVFNFLRCCVLFIWLVVVIILKLSLFNK